MNPRQQDIVRRIKEFADWMTSSACGNVPDEATLADEAAREIEELVREVSIWRRGGRKALLDVAEERARQVAVEGWTLEHDDMHSAGEMARAAASYAYEAGRTDAQRAVDHGDPPLSWPWDSGWWKPTDRRRDLVKAAALIIAEIERLDRLKVTVDEGEAA